MVKNVDSSHIAEGTYMLYADVKVEILLSSYLELHRKVTDNKTLEIISILVTCNKP